MPSQAERIAVLEVHRENHASNLEDVRKDLHEVKAKVDDIHSGMRVFIVLARGLTAFGVLMMFFKGAASWGDVSDAFRSI